MCKQIPEEIQYLRPVLEKLKSFDPDELGDDNQEAMDLVEAAFEPVTQNLTENEAVELLKKHHQILKNWMPQAGDTEVSAAYIFGALGGMLAFKYGDYSAMMGGAE